MKLAYISNASFGNSSSGKKILEHRKKVLNEVSSNETQIDIIDNSLSSVSSIETSEDGIKALLGTLENIRIYQDKGYDGLITGCFGDPGFDATREVANIPLASPGLSSFHIAAQLGIKFGVITPKATTMPMVIKQVESVGLANKLAGVESLDMPVIEIRNNRKKTLKQAIKVGEKLLNESNADTIVLGCMSMAFHRVHLEITKNLNVPVVDPVTVVVRTAELLVSAGLKQSPRVYL